MIDWGNFALLRPWWLLALPVLAGIGWRRGRGGRLAGWTAAMDPSLSRAMERFGRVLPGKPPGRWLPLTLAAVLVIALSGPALRTSEAPVFRNLDGVVVVMDLSRSVALGGGLAGAVAAGRLVTEAAAGRPVALVVYAGDAYLASPFTTDARAVGTTIAALDGETVPEAGSCLRCALAVTRGMLAETGTLASDVIVISDGAGIAAVVEEVAGLVAAGARISTLAVGAPAAVSDMPPPDPGALAALAEQGGGWSGEAAHPGAVLDAIAARPGSGALGADLAGLSYTDLGRYLVVLPLMLSLGLFRRSA